MTTPARASDIVFTRHAGRRGVAWLADAWRLFARAPLGWLVLVAVYMVFLSLPALLPFAAPLFLLLRPVFAVGLLSAAWTQERGGRPQVGQLFHGFRSNWRALLAIGAISIGGFTLAIILTALLDGGTLMELAAPDVSATQESIAAKTNELLKSGRLQRSVLIATTLSIPVILALWFAPALVVFQDAGPITALGASLRATLANWRPVLLYALVIALFGGLLPMLVSTALATILPADVAQPLTRTVSLAYGLAFAAVLYISDYVGYRDVFHAGETLAPLARPAQSE